MQKARLEEQYFDKIRFQLKESLNIKNIMDVPRISKIVLNVGVKDAVTDSKALPVVIKVLTNIAGQRAVATRARKSIAGFKLREGMLIGVRVTLRRRNMYNFWDKLINIALPKVRDFQGVSTKFDGQGNYNLGVKEWIIFPEVDYEMGGKIYGLNITIHTTAKTDGYAFELFKSFDMPFASASI